MASEGMQDFGALFDITPEVRKVVDAVSLVGHTLLIEDIEQMDNDGGLYYRWYVVDGATQERLTFNCGKDSQLGKQAIKYLMSDIDGQFAGKMVMYGKYPMIGPIRN